MSKRVQNTVHRFLDKLPNIMPTQINKMIIDSKIDHFYRWIKYKSSDKRTQVYQNSIGELELTAPAETAENFIDLEPGLVSELNENLSKSDVFYDIGANFGYFTRFAELVGVPAENIYAFESSFYYYNYLQRNCSDQIHLIHDRVSNVSNENMISIDDFVTELNVPTVIKIDVDGFEYKILQGMSELLSQHGPVLYVEVHPELLSDNVNETDIFKFMRNYNYDIDFCNHKCEDGYWTEDEDSIPYATAYPTPQYLMRGRLK